MKAIVMTDYGGPDVLRLVDKATPTPGPGEALVAVRAIGVNPVDYKVREGRMKAVAQYAFPFTPGYDFAGVVEALGPGVDSVAVGDRVLAMADFAVGGAYAQYVVLAASLLARIPPGMSLEIAAAIPMCSLTAEKCVASEEGAMIERGQTLFIQGGASNVGAFAIQLAKARGARVIATCSTANGAYVADLGADLVIDYTHCDVDDLVEQADVVVDLIGGPDEEKLWRRVRPGGTFVTAVGRPNPDRAAALGVRHARIYAAGDGTKLAGLATWVAEHEATVLVAQVMPLSRAADAQVAVAVGHGRGKVILDPAA